MDKIKRFFECLVPISVCNLKCSYCYVAQQSRNDMKIEDFYCSPEHIAKGLNKERVGGVCWINLCGLGETTAHPHLPQLTRLLLEEGHYVSITTNGTLKNKLNDILKECSNNLQHLHFAFSLHYIELISHGLLDTFFENIKLVKNAGASILIQINMCDEYMPHIDEIKNLCKMHVGAWPQVALTRNEKSNPMSIMTSGTIDNYLEHGRKFDSPLFEFTVKNFMVKRTEFCYAGDWSGIINFKNGILKKCYDFIGGVNIFDDIEAPIPFEAIGNNCKSAYCVNSSHFMSLGVIPEIPTPTYAQLRNRENANWYSNNIMTILNQKLYENNKQYSQGKKRKINKKYKAKKSLRESLSQFPFYQKLHKIKTSLLIFFNRRDYE